MKISNCPNKFAIWRSYYINFNWWRNWTMKESSKKKKFRNNKYYYSKFQYNFNINVWYPTNMLSRNHKILIIIKFIIWPPINSRKYRNLRKEKIWIKGRAAHLTSFVYALFYRLRTGVNFRCDKIILTCWSHLSINEDTSRLSQMIERQFYFADNNDISHYWRNLEKRVLK